MRRRYFALSEGWTDEQQPPISKARPLSQWAWQPEYDSVYGAPLEAAVVTNLTGGDQLYTRRFERCTVSLAINSALGNSSNASIDVLKTDDTPTARMPTGVERARSARGAAGVHGAMKAAGRPGNLTYLSYYTVGKMPATDNWGEHYTIPGPQGTEAGINLVIGFANGPDSFGTGIASLPHIRDIWEQRAVPSFYTPDSWYTCDKGHAACRLVPGWQEVLQSQAAALRPLIKSGAVRGVFYGDELGCGGVPFWAVDAVTSYFRAALGERDGLVHHTNACEMTLGCPPPPLPVCNICQPGCGNSSSKWLSRYWPHVPAALDFVSVDVSACFPRRLRVTPTHPG